jgi:hypothetical protein
LIFAPESSRYRPVGDCATVFRKVQ